MNTFKEDFAKFLEEPTREGFRELIKNNFGEENNLDFKKEWPSLSKMAKHMLAFGNSGGGCIIIGVEQTADGEINVTGLQNFIDKATIKNSINNFIPSELDSLYNIMEFSFDDTEYSKIKGKKFQIVIVENSNEYIPFISKKDGDGIRKNAIYVRKGTSSEEALYEDIQKIINRRIESGHSSRTELELKEHLTQLKILYDSIDKYKYMGFGLNIPLITERLQMTMGKQENPYYPKEDYEGFIARVITDKKKKIKLILELK